MTTPVTIAVKEPPLIPALGLISFIAGVLIVIAYEFTLPAIEANQQRAIDEALGQLLPLAARHRDFVVEGGTLRPAGAHEPRDLAHIYAGYDSRGGLQGLALPGAAQGYQGMIHLMYSYNPECRCITGMKIIQAVETPGLGNRINSDRGFLANFAHLDARLNDAGTGLAHGIVAVRHGRKQQDWEIDAISGATVSSKAVAKAVDRSSRRLLPVIHRQSAVLKDASRESR